MGLLDRWIKKKTAEQLNRDTEPTRTLSDEKKEVVASQESKAAVSTEPKKAVRSKTVKDPKITTKKTTKTKKEVVAEVPKISAQNLGNVYKVIIAPVITEKNAFLQSRYNQYVFKVTPSAKKEQIKQAVKELYGVTPDKIRIINMQGKYVRFGKYLGRRGDFKKALVTLPKGSSITIHESV